MKITYFDVVYKNRGLFHSICTKFEEHFTKIHIKTCTHTKTKILQ